MALEYSIRMDSTLTCEGRPADPDDCVLLQKVSGLDGRDRRMQTEPAAGSDGDIFGPATRAGITLVIEALIVGASGAGLRTRERALRALLEPGDASATMLVEVLGRSGDPAGGIRAHMRVVAPLRSPDDAGDGRAKPATWALAAEPAYWLGPTDLTVSVNPTAWGLGVGFALDFEMDFGDTTEPGTSVVNAGNARVWPVLRMYGPVTSPAIANLATGDALYFPNLTIAETEFVEVRTTPGERAVLVNGTSSAYATLDRTGSSWFPLAPGSNPILFAATSYDTGARLDVLYADGYV